MNCLLSHPCVLSLQNIKFVALDNEIAEYYINFLKGLSRKLDSNSMHMFFNKVNNPNKSEIPIIPPSDADNPILQSP